MLSELILRSAVLCIAHLQERRKETNKQTKKWKNSFPVGGPATAILQHPGFWCCYVL
jgi:hypothetical protein